MNCSPPGSSVHEDSSGEKTGVGCHAFLQGIFVTQGSNPGLSHCKWILCCLSHQVFSYIKAFSYIYIYICVCVCVYILLFISRVLSSGQLLINTHKIILAMLVSILARRNQGDPNFGILESFGISKLER